MTRDTLRDLLVTYAKGLCMGAADTVPGISGGTIALITGIYERLVTAIATLEPRLLAHATRLHDPAGRAALRRDLAAADVAFLVALAAGIATAVVGLSGLLGIALREFRAPTNAFFFGLIAASAVVLYGEVHLDTPRRIGAAVTAAVAAFLVTGVTAAGGLPHGLPVVLVAGALASAAMLLPGISGAAFLYVLGQYEYLIGTLHGFLAAVLAVPSGGPASAVLRPGSVVAVFLVGVAVGLLTIARAVRWALRVDRATTLTILVSLMVGALRLPAAEVLAATARWTPTTLAGIVTAGVVGAGIVLALDRYTDDLDYGEE